MNCWTERHRTSCAVPFCVLGGHKSDWVQGSFWRFCPLSYSNRRIWKVDTYDFRLIWESNVMKHVCLYFLISISEFWRCHLVVLIKDFSKVIKGLKSCLFAYFWYGKAAVKQKISSFCYFLFLNIVFESHTSGIQYDSLELTLAVIKKFRKFF